MTMIFKNFRECKKYCWKRKKWFVFWYSVKNADRYWVVEFDDEKNVLSIEEKPENPKSNFAIPWIYFYPNDVVEIAKNLQKSYRWEYEITDVSKEYLKQKRLKVDILPRWYAWLDTWTHESMMESSTYIEILEKRQWIKTACLEEIAYIKWWIWKDDVLKQAEKMGKSSYWEYLKNLI